MGKMIFFHVNTKAAYSKGAVNQTTHFESFSISLLCPSLSKGRFKIKWEIPYVWVLHHIYNCFQTYFALSNGSMPVFSGTERKQAVIQVHRF